MNKAILRSPGKQLKSPFVRLVLDELPQVASCLAFVGNHNLIYRLLGGLWLTPEDSNQEVEQWLDFEESVDGAKYLGVVIKVDKPSHQPEPLR